MIVPVLRNHLAVFVKDEPRGPVFPSGKGGPLRRSGFAKLSAWGHAVESIGTSGYGALTGESRT